MQTVILERLEDELIRKIADPVIVQAVVRTHVLVLPEYRERFKVVTGVNHLLRHATSPFKDFELDSA